MQRQWVKSEDCIVRMYTAAAATCLQRGRPISKWTAHGEQTWYEGLVTFSIRCADTAGVDVKRPTIGSIDYRNRLTNCTPAPHPFPTRLLATPRSCYCGGEMLAANRTVVNASVNLTCRVVAATHESESDRAHVRFSDLLMCADLTNLRSTNRPNST